MRKLWFEAIKGTQSVELLMPQVFSECPDIWMLIGSSLSVKDLLAMRQTSTHKQKIVEMTLIDQLNTGKIIPNALGISTVTSLIDFFGENCSQITQLNLQNFHDTINSDIKKISEHFGKLKHLFLKGSAITNASVIHLEKMKLLKSLEISRCTTLKDFSFLQHIVS